MCEIKEVKALPDGTMEYIPKNSQVLKKVVFMNKFTGGVWDDSYLDRIKGVHISDAIGANKDILGVL